MKSITLAKGCASIVCAYAWVNVRVCVIMAYVCHSIWASCTRTRYVQHVYRSISVIGDAPFMVIDQLNSFDAEIITNTIDYIAIIMSHQVLSISLFFNRSPARNAPFSHLHMPTHSHFTFIYAWMCIVETRIQIQIHKRFLFYFFGTLNISQLHEIKRQFIESNGTCCSCIFRLDKFIRTWLNGLHGNINTWKTIKAMMKYNTTITFLCGKFCSPIK